MRLIKQVLPSLGSDVVMVAVDVDSSESADLLRRYADREGFGWRHAVAPREMLVSLSDAFGARFLFPPEEPKLVVDTKGSVRSVFGPLDEPALRDLVTQARR